MDDTLFQKIVEKVEVLNGDRPRAGALAAVRRGEIRELTAFVAGLQGGAAGLTKTIQIAAAQVATLREDMVALLADFEGSAGAVTTLQEGLAAAVARIDAIEPDLTAAAEAIIELQASAETLADLQAAAAAVAAPTLTAANVTAAPTMADFNKVVADLAALLAYTTSLKGAVS